MAAGEGRTNRDSKICATVCNDHLANYEKQFTFLNFNVRERKRTHRVFICLSRHSKWTVHFLSREKQVVILRIAHKTIWWPTDQTQLTKLTSKPNGNGERINQNFQAAHCEGKWISSGAHDSWSGWCGNDEKISNRNIFTAFRRQPTEAIVGQVTERGWLIWRPAISMATNQS